MRVVLLLLIPLLLFSAWQYTRREENENRLALVAGAVALRDVDVSCPGFWTRLVEITPNAGWVDFDEHGRPSDETSLSASTCGSLERIWRGKQGSFRCLVTGGCDGRTLDAVSGLVTLAHESWHLRGIVNEARTQCYADPDDRGGRAEPRRRSRRRARDCPTRGRGRLSRTRGRVPLRAVPARRRVRPASRHSRLAQRLAASRAARTRTAEHRPGGASCAGRRRRTFPRRLSGSESGVLGAGGGPSREISSYRSSSCTKTRWLAGAHGRSLGSLDGEPPQLLDLRAQTLVELLESADVAVVAARQLLELALALGERLLGRRELRPLLLELGEERCFAGVRLGLGSGLGDLGSTTCSVVASSARSGTSCTIRFRSLSCRRWISERRPVPKPFSVVSSMPYCAASALASSGPETKPSLTIVSPSRCPVVCCSASARSRSSPLSRPCSTSSRPRGRQVMWAASTHSLSAPLPVAARRLVRNASFGVGLGVYRAAPRSGVTARVLAPVRKARERGRSSTPPSPYAS